MMNTSNQRRKVAKIKTQSKFISVFFVMMFCLLTSSTTSFRDHEDQEHKHKKSDHPRCGRHSDFFLICVRVCVFFFN